MTLADLLPLVFVLPREGAFVAMTDHPDWALISISDPGTAPYCRPLEVRTTGPRLDLQFDDLARCAPANHPELVPPQREHAEAIVGFARQLIHNPPEALVVHCAVGFSRSPAAALGVFATWLGPGQDRLACKRVTEACRAGVAHGWRAEASNAPNRRLVALFDRVLDRRHDLVQAWLDHYYRATNASEEQEQFDKIVSDADRR